MEKRRKLEQIIEKGIRLADHSSYKIGGEARFFARPANLEELQLLVEHCQKSGLIPYFFGLGSNILFSDRPHGETVFISLKNMAGWEKTDEGLLLQAGFPLSYLAYTGQPGLLFTHLLPGTLGASIYMNARCYEGEMSGILNRVFYLDPYNMQKGIQKIEKRECLFSYKKSIFQEKPWIILGAEVTMNNPLPDWWSGEVNQLESLNLSTLEGFFQYFAHTLFSRVQMGPEFREKLQQIAADREGKKQFSYPSCGSVFKNNYDYGIPTGILVEQLGLKGLRQGGAMISPHHGNFIINFDNATAADVQYLMNIIREGIDHKFGFIPEPEVVIVDGKPGK